ncbi:MAG: hypothetical protein WCI77_00900 [Candidatus Omnitrophota bacterium]
MGKIKAGIIRECNRPALQLATVFVIVLSTHLIFVFMVGDYGWDDGAITLAFSRTLAYSSKIALTPVSEVVEGFSTPAWMVIFSLIAKIFRPSFSVFIRSSQIVAGVCASIGACLFCRLSAKIIPRAAAVLASILLFCSSSFINETANGMENSLGVMLVLFIATLIDRGKDKKPAMLINIALFLLSFILVTVRFEFAFYQIIASLFLMSGFSCQALWMTTGSLSGFVLLTLVRINIFGTYLPNTIWAKCQPPYSYYRGGAVLHWYYFLKDRYNGCMQMFSPFKFLWLSFIPLFFLTRMLGRILVPKKFILTLSALERYAIGYCVAVLIFSTVIGKSWSYDARLQLSALPLLFYLLLSISSRVFLIPKKLLSACFIYAMIICIADSINKYPPSGGMMNFKTVHASNAAIGWRSVTPANFKITGNAVEHLRRALGLETISFLVPDIGGLALGHERVRVLDSALLANAFLAKYGYKEFAHYIEAQKPDVIVTHSIWSEVSGIYKSQFFKSSYIPIVIDDNWVYVRQDHVDFLSSKNFLSPLPINSFQPLLRYRGFMIDEMFVNSQGFSPNVKQLKEEPHEPNH